MYLDDKGYIARTNRPGRRYSAGRNWWLVKFAAGKNRGCVSLGTVLIPSKYIGKKVRFKIELADDDDIIESVNDFPINIDNVI